MSVSSSNISELPIDPGISQSSNNNNVIMETTEKKTLADDVLQASNSGLTSLPTRDIPMTTANHLHDVTTNANYIPENSQPDYIDNHNTELEYQRGAQQDKNRKSNFDIMFEEFQVPILIGLLYFMFQLPIFKSTLHKFFDFLFKKDGNYNLGGYISVSALFGLSFYITQRIIEHFSI